VHAGIAQKDGSIVLSVGLIFVAAKVMKAWQKREFRIEENFLNKLRVPDDTHKRLERRRR
jgi:hypothetical protein